MVPMTSRAESLGWPLGTESVMMMVWTGLIPVVIWTGPRWISVRAIRVLVAIGACSVPIVFGANLAWVAVMARVAVVPFRTNIPFSMIWAGIMTMAIRTQGLPMMVGANAVLMPIWTSPPHWT